MTGNIALDFAADWTQKQLDYQQEQANKLQKYQYQDELTEQETNE